MNEQEMYVRVGELATRVGYPMPSIERTDQRAPMVQLKAGAVGPTMILRCHAEELPPQVFDFLVTQELVQARQGGLKHKWLVVPIALAGGLALGTATDWPGWVVWIVLMAIYYLGIRVFNTVWRRRYIWRSDRMVTEILGGDEMRSALHWLDECQPWPKNLRWLWQGATQPPADRLRRLGLLSA
ncbi:hypothetical protein [Kribbella sp. NPDC051770]|uniref:hypothetical protein n=1 Tax=Kribbella sp. NPDC051770 TaxID=3155413 RepID=UPI00342512DB